MEFVNKMMPRLTMAALIAQLSCPPHRHQQLPLLQQHPPLPLPRRPRSCRSQSRRPLFASCSWSCPATAAQTRTHSLGAPASPRPKCPRALCARAFAPSGTTRPTTPAPRATNRPSSRVLWFSPEFYTRRRLRTDFRWGTSTVSAPNSLPRGLRRISCRPLSTAYRASAAASVASPRSGSATRARPSARRTARRRRAPRRPESRPLLFASRPRESEDRSCRSRQRWERHTTASSSSMTNQLHQASPVLSCNLSSRCGSLQKLHSRLSSSFHPPVLVRVVLRSSRSCDRLLPSSCRTS
mmetsp:Transcript_25782/g.64991  ORF Transcript_25782/g.64991 Transcript_25782/m.64991 type:complete len:297 (-) Transcript_25782:2088-2978(-)